VFEEEEVVVVAFEVNDSFVQVRSRKLISSGRKKGHIGGCEGD